MYLRTSVDASLAGLFFTVLIYIFTGLGQRVHVHVVENLTACVYVMLRHVRLYF
jgi:hypothetical protein